jgi:two-component system nitrate/nitrite response regulator NarL
MASPTAVHAEPSDRKVRILLADDHDGIRRVVRSVLESHSRFEIIGEAIDGKKAIEEAIKLKPDVVVLNVSMPVLNGFEAARAITAKLPQSAIVILSSNADEKFVEEAKKIGAKAYVAKTKVGNALIKAIEDAIAGGDFVLVD